MPAKPIQRGLVKQRPDLPWSAERIARQPNECVPEIAHPKKDRRELFFSGAAGWKPSLERVQGGWSLQVPTEVNLGLVAQEERSAAKTPRKAKSKGRFQLAPYRPQGAPVVYHPPVVRSLPRRIVRRRNGTRMQQHGIIFGNDDREIFNPGDAYPWRCAGRLLVWNNPGAFFWDPPDGTGTAALVGPNMVVTSSHMVPEGVTRFKACFLPGLFGTKRSFDEFSYMQTWRRYTPCDQGSDIALLKLYDPIGARLGWFGTKTYDDDWEDGNYWTRIGYAPIAEKGSDGTMPNRVQFFPIIDDDDSYGVELEYRSDASSGDSGGPVFGWWDDGPYIVGVHSGGEEEVDLGAFGRFFTVLNNVAAGGLALPDLVNWGWSNWN